MAEDRAAPSGVVAFLFTDIEGSTRRWEANAEKMLSALRIHDAVLGEAVDHGYLWHEFGDSALLLPARALAAGAGQASA